MLIASCDIETTGLDLEYCQVLEVGIVLWETTDLDTPVTALPAFHCYLVHERTVGEPFALGMNQKILQRIANREDGYEYLQPNLVGQYVAEWLGTVAPHLFDPKKGEYQLTPTGFNFDSFDRQFLDRLPYFTDWIKFGHRSLGPGTLFFNPHDEKLPSSDEVFRRAGVTVVDRHTALGDARGVVEVLRAAFRGDDPAPVPAPPRCPNCGDRQSILIPSARGADWVQLPCPICVPKMCHDDAVIPNRIAQYLEA